MPFWQGRMDRAASGQGSSAFGSLGKLVGKIPVVGGFLNGGAMDRGALAQKQYPMDPSLYQVQGADELARFHQQNMEGQNSISALQLREAADRGMGQQMAAAAAAQPGNSAMAQRLAMINMGRIGSGLAGQQAMAGIAERNAAAQSLQGLRGLQLQGTMTQGAHGTERFKALTQTPTELENWMSGVTGLLGAGSKMDQR